MKSLSLAAAAFVATMPIAASAATTVNATAGFVQSYSELLSAGEVVEYNIIPDANLQFSFALSGSGTQADLHEVTFGFASTGTQPYIVVMPDPVNPGLYAGIGFLASLTTSSPFSVYYVGSSSIASDPAVTLTITATAVTTPPLPTVPVPAAGLLLLSGAGALAALRRKR